MNTKILKVNSITSGINEAVGVVEYLTCVDFKLIARIGKPRATLLQRKSKWSSKVLTLQTKIRLSEVNVKSVFLYGTEAWWTAVVTLIKQVQAFINSLLQRILHIFCPNLKNNH
jgi:hypothetical protein